ncbi:MAG: peptide ABC transporter substrate-binding protein [Bacilli bacterium]
MKTRIKQALTVAAAVAMAVSTFAYAHAASVTPAGGPGTFTYYTIDYGDSFDPALFTWDGRQDQTGIFEGLVHFGKNFSIARGIATHWTSNGDVWTFYLRHNARFSNGDPVTAQDFVYSIRRAVSPAIAVAAKHPSSWFGDVPIKNANKVLAGAPSSILGVTALNTYTLRFTLDKPDPNLLTQLCTAIWQLPVDPRVVQGQPATIWSNPKTIVSDGPYMLKSYKTGTDEVLVPNPYYYKKVPLKEIHVINIPASGVEQLLPFVNHETDMALLNPQDVPAVMKNPALKSQLRSVATAITYTLQVTPSMNPALQSEKVRQAFSMAIDRTAISKSVLLGTGVPAYDGRITTWMAPWISKVGFHYNPTEAQKLMAEAGYPGGKGFPTVEILTASPDKVAEAIQQMWEQTLGVKVQLNEVAYGTYIEDLTNVLPANEVGFTQFGQEPQYPTWQSTLPLNVNGYMSTSVPIWSMPAADQVTYENLQKQTSNASQKIVESAAIIAAHESEQVRRIMDLGVRARETGNTALAKSYVTEKNHLAYVIPVYTVNNFLLVRSDVHGYYPMRMWLATPPIWLGYITA